MRYPHKLTLYCSEARTDGRRAHIRRITPRLQTRRRLDRDLMDEIYTAEDKRYLQSSHNNTWDSGFHNIPSFKVEKRNHTKHTSKCLLYCIVYLRLHISITIHIFKEFYLHFSSTYRHQNLECYSSLYSEGFYCGVCSYFTHINYYSILF